MKRVKDRKIVVVLCGIAIVLCLVFGVCFRTNGINAYADDGAKFDTYESSAVQTAQTDGVDMQSESDEFTMDSVLSECKRMTDSDVIGVVNGVTYTLDNYHTITGAMPDKRELEYKLNYMMIPEELFYHEGYWSYCGKEYGFLVSTWAPLGGYAYMSDVVLIDLTHEIIGTEGKLKFKAEIKYTAKYATNVSGGKYYSWCYSDLTSSKYYLCDIEFFSANTNVYEPNRGDAEYDFDEDNSPILRQVGVNYSGAYYEETDILKNIGSFMFSGIKIGTKKLLDGTPIEKFISAYDDIEEMLTKAHVMFTQYYENPYECNSESNIYTMESRTVQRENGYFVTALTATPKDKYILVDDYIELITLLDDTNKATYIESGIAFRFAEYRNGRLYCYIADNKAYDPRDNMRSASHYTAGFSGVLFDKDTEAKVGDNAGYLLHDESSQIFEFTAAHRGEYSFSVDAGKRLEVSTDKLNWLYKNELDTVELKKGDKEYIRIRNGSDYTINKTFNLHIEYIPKIITAPYFPITGVSKDNYEHYLFTPTTSGVYEIGCSVKNISEQKDIIKITVFDSDNKELSGKSNKYIKEFENNQKYSYIEKYHYLEEKKQYRIKLETESEQELSVQFSLKNGDILQKDYNFEDEINGLIVFTYIPQKEGEYVFNYTPKTGIRSYYTKNANLINTSKSIDWTPVSDTINVTKAFETYYFLVGTINDDEQYSITCSIETKIEVEHYSVTAAVYYNDTIKLMFHDSKGNYVYGTGEVYTSASYFYKYGGIEYPLTSIDISHLPYGVEVGAVVTFTDGHVEKPTCTYSGTVYNMWSSINMSGLTKVTIDARNSSQNGNMTLTVPSNVNTLNFMGTKIKTYNSFNIVVESRTTELAIYLYDFSFTAANASAIKTSSSGSVSISVMVDECSIRTTQYGAAAIDANTFIFNQGVLKVYGSSQVASSTNKYGGRGINLGSALYVNGGQLYTYGGSGINSSSNNGTGYRGALGGDGLMAYYVYMNNDGMLFCFGGNGGNGCSGASGKKGGDGGRGGNGAYISGGINGNKSNVYLYGGNGGNGGNGGSGAAGGSGGIAGPGSGKAIDLTGVHVTNGSAGTAGSKG